MNDRRHNVQDLGLPSVRHIAVIIHQDGFEQRWNHVGIDRLKVISLLHIGIDEFQDLLLNGAKASDFGRLCRNDSWWSQS